MAAQGKPLLLACLLRGANSLGPGSPPTFKSNKAVAMMLALAPERGGQAPGELWVAIGRFSIDL